MLPRSQTTHPLYCGGGDQFGKIHQVLNLFIPFGPIIPYQGIHSEEATSDS